ncbi:18699_t:CDS:2 [Gigaspora margarita]|uniref:18699_t:CDS:1 n=1 Tax=Gigaspora margarita TaxID=4874 RepID=A0ABN7VK62_GIGMA|nr:18699_t:CDS:2 [Gigaspora margarita]
MVTIKIQEQKLRTQHITKKFELKDYLNKSELIDNIIKKKNEIKQLKNILEISNFKNDKNSPSRQERKYEASVNFMEIPISTKQAFYDCSNYINHTEDSSLNQDSFLDQSKISPNKNDDDDNIDTTSISSLENIKEKLISWQKIDINIKKKEKIEKLKHFFKPKKLYFKLWHVATQPTPSDFKSLNPTKKSLNDILFGTNPTSKIVKGWMSKIISPFLEITDKTERKI